MSSPAVSRPSSSARVAPRAVAPPRIAPWFPLLLALAVAAATALLLLDLSQATVSQQPVVAEGDQSRVMSEPEPEPGSLSALLGVGAFVTVVLGPLVAMWVAAWAATWAWLSWEQLRSRDRAFLLLAAVVAVGVVAVDFSSVGQDVTRRMLD